MQNTLVLSKNGELKFRNVSDHELKEIRINGYPYYLMKKYYFVDGQGKIRFTTKKGYSLFIRLDSFYAMVRLPSRQFDALKAEEHFNNAMNIFAWKDGKKVTRHDEIMEELEEKTNIVKQAYQREGMTEAELFEVIINQWDDLTAY